MADTCNPGSALDDLLSGDGALASIIKGSDALPYTQLPLTSSKCLAARRVIRVHQRQNVNVSLAVTDVNGFPINLSSGLPSEGSSDNGGSSGGPQLPVVFIAKAQYRDSRPYIVEWCEIENPAEGLVKLTLTREMLERPGLYHAQVVVLSEDRREAYAVTPYWLEISPGLGTANVGPITIAELRMEMRDVCADQNFLLGDVEFTDEDIVHAISKPVEEFNESFAPATRYTTANFPWRFNWRRAAAAYLLQTASWHYERNNLAYSAGDVAIKDKDKFGVYSREAVRLLTEWRDFIAHKKVELNAKRAWGYAQSPLSRGGIQHGTGI